MAAHNRHKPVKKWSILDVISEGTTPACMLVNMLKDANSLGSVRLACRGLRSQVDQHVSSIRITIRPADKDRWAAGLLPSVERWPSCTNVELHIDNSECAHEEHGPNVGWRVDLAGLASLPFLGLSATARERPWTLTITSELPILPSYEAEVIVTSLSAMLPGLSHLHLQALTNMSYEPVRQQLMYVSLASLPHLEQLILPSCRALERIGALAGRLPRLDVLPPGLPGPDSAISMAAAAGIAQLHGLKRLVLGPCSLAAAREAKGPGPDPSLRLLFDNLPPSLETLALQDWRPDGSVDEAVRVDFSMGHASAINVGTGTVDPLQGLGDVAALAAALMVSRALGPELEHLSVDAIGVRDGEALDAPAYAPLWSLLRRCARLDVRELHASSAAAAVRALARIGRPRRLVLQTNAPDGGLARVRLRLRAARVVQAPWGIDTSEEAHVQGQGQGTASMPRSPLGPSTSASPLRPGTAPAPRSPALPLSPDATGLALPAEAASPGAELTISMLQAMLGRLIGGASALRYNGTGSGAALAPALATASQPPAGNLAAVIAAARVAPEPAPDGSSSRLLLLCGPFVASWAADTRTLHDVMRSLAVHAAAARRARKGATAGSSDLFLSYQLLPASVAVLLTCADAEAAVDVAAAVAVLAGVCRGLAFDLDVLPVAAEVDANPVAEVEAANLVAEAEVGSRPEGGPVERFGREVVLQALQEVLQSLWDELHGSCGGGPAAELALLRRLLGGWEQLAAEMPAEVAL